MKNQYFEELMVYQPSSEEDKILYWSHIVNSVLNAFLTITAILFNSVTIQALRKTSSLPHPLKTMLLSLAVSDLAVGLLVEPFYIGLLVNWLQREISTEATRTAFLLIGPMFSTVSFLGVMLLSVDRFLAVQLHLRYQELVTHKRVVAVVISTWVYSACLSLFYTVWISPNISYMVVAISGVVYLVFSAMLHFTIYRAVRRHRIQIQALQVQPEVQNGQIANAARLTRSAVGVFYIYLVFWLCYGPMFCSSALVVIAGVSTEVKVVFMTSFTFLHLNSTLNPVIYCWKMKHVRRAVLNILRNILPSQN